MPDRNVHDISQSDVSLNENPTGNTFNYEVTTLQGPMGDDDEIESQKVWTMEMPTNDGNILTTTTNGLEQTKRSQEVPVCQAMHSNQPIQYHMQQIME